jgi:U3 small nucleolar RNA-associated protein 25
MSPCQFRTPTFMKQNFIRFDCASPKDEAEKRFHHFTTHVCRFPVLRAPNVDSFSGLTCRVEISGAKCKHRSLRPFFFRLHSCAKLFQKIRWCHIRSSIRVCSCYPVSSVFLTTSHRYSSNQDISRARQAFFQGKKSFLLISERFHFYRRSTGLSTPPHLPADGDFH